MRFTWMTVRNDSLTYPDRQPTVSNLRLATDAFYTNPVSLLQLAFLRSDHMKQPPLLLQHTPHATVVAATFSISNKN